MRSGQRTAAWVTTTPPMLWATRTEGYRAATRGNPCGPASIAVGDPAHRAPTTIASYLPTLMISSP